MARPVTIDDDVILAAARAVFLAKGLRGTTAEVARKASVAEGSIFNRFPSKVALFQAAMQPALEDPPWLADLERQVSVGDLAQHMCTIGNHAIDFFGKLMPLLMMAWSSNPAGPAGPAGRHPLGGKDPAPLRILARLTAFFAAEMRAGRLRTQSPEVLARAFIGGLQNYVLFELLLKPPRAPRLDRERYVADLVSALWHGASPGAPAKDRAKAKAKERQS